MDPKLIVFILANLIMTVALMWGLRVIISLLKSRRADEASILSEALSEKSFSPTEGGVPQQGKVGSFSRVAGAFGALGLAVAMIGISYWLVYALFYEKNLAVLQTAGWFFLSGSALFAPYAFNQLSSVFKIS